MSWAWIERVRVRPMLVHRVHQHSSGVTGVLLLDA